MARMYCTFLSDKKLSRQQMLSFRQSLNSIQGGELNDDMFTFIIN